MVIDWTTSKFAKKKLGYGVTNTWNITQRYSRTGFMVLLYIYMSLSFWKDLDEHVMAYLGACFKFTKQR